MRKKAWYSIKTVKEDKKDCLEVNKQFIFIIETADNYIQPYSRHF